jgi:serine/threonine protein kinase
MHAEVQIAEIGAANLSDSELYFVCDLRVRLGMALHAASAVAYLHSAELAPGSRDRAKLVHRDIKSLNFLVTDDFTVKLADFGDSRMVAAADAPMTQRRGTLRWAAPEVMQGKQADEQYSEKVDIYSLGIVLWELMTGMVPFAELSEFMVVSQVVAGARPKIPQDLPAPLRRLLKAMWHRNPSRRPSADQVCSQLCRCLNWLNLQVEHMFWLQQHMPATGLKLADRNALKALIQALA